MSLPALPTGTVTFLFTDVEGSTKLLHKLGTEGYAHALAEHRRALREAFVRHGGVEVDTQGDAFFVAFASAPEALAAAEAGEQALATGPIRVRMGLHTGMPFLGDEGYVGADVHLGARIAAAGHGGQILLSKATRELLGDGPQDLGEHRLKDFDDPVWIFQLGPGEFPPLKTLSNTNLPRPASSFVGRERETAEVLALLRNSARLVTLSGPGGTGKTRLAVEAAAELLPDFRNGVYWVGLATLRDPALVAQTIAQALGAGDGLAEHIAERYLLLLLDNFEQVVDAAADLSSLLSACPNLRLLVTSRERLRIQGEREYPVPPLAEPDAVELFCQRSGLEPGEAIADLCSRLDNLPLAVELAAARANVLSPAQILERLAQRLDLLRGGRDADPRQLTLRATIAWSHDLLGDDERALFARLAVFSGGCSLGAAEEVADATIDTLQSLVDKSLVRHTNERFWMLETIREYAREQLAGSGAEPQMRGAHAHYLLGVAEEAAARYDDSPGEALACFAAEHDNVRSALAWARDARDDEVLRRLAKATDVYWAVRGLDREARPWLRLAARRSTAASEAGFDVRLAAAAYALDAGDLEEADELLADALAAANRKGDRRGAARVLNNRARLAHARGDVEGARAQMLEVRDAAQALGDRAMQATAATNLGALGVVSGDCEAGLRHSLEAVRLHRARGRQAGVALALSNCGWASLGLADEIRAAEFFREAVGVAGELGHALIVRGGALGLAALSLSQCAHDRAARLLGAEARVQEEMGIELDVHEEGVRQRTVAEARAALGDDAFAAAFARGHAMTQDEIVELCGDERPGASKDDDRTGSSPAPADSFT